MYPTDVTVAAVVEHDGRYLLVEESALGRVVLSQPGGHVKAGESAEDAVVREETGCTITCGDLIGVYLWIHPQTRQQFLRLVYAGRFVDCDESLPLDDAIRSRLWLPRRDPEARRAALRTPAVLRCVQDYEAGRRESDALISAMLPLASNVDRVLARADLV